jgi:hypothetical protein
LEEVSPSGCKGGSEEVRSPGIFNLVQIMPSEGCKLGREVMFQGFHFFIYGGMHVFIDGGNIGTELCTSYWVSMKEEDKELKWASRSWLRVWAMMKGGNGKGWVGPHRKGVMGEGYHDDQGDEGNPMG